jgi:hypothetical protein
METINGTGTTLYGKRYLTKKELSSMGIEVKGVEPYLATKWFVFFWIPLIPISSWVIFAESEKSDILSTEKQYQMLPVNLNWNQVLKWWMITVGVIFLFWLILHGE